MKKNLPVFWCGADRGDHIFYDVTFQSRSTESVVVTRFEKIQSTYGPQEAGLHWKAPWRSTACIGMTPGCGRSRRNSGRSGPNSRRPWS